MAQQKTKSFKSKLLALLSLTKLKITRTVVITTFLGYYLATGSRPQRPFDVWNCALVLFATACVCAGVCVFNHVLEWKTDAKMSRTKTRPLPLKLITPLEATLFGSALTLVGLMIMGVFFSPLLAWGALGTGILYDFCYTPLKRISAWNTTVGAFPGALPVLGGAVAVSQTLSPAVIIVFLIVFLWQHPHFYAIAWTYRSDYAEAGYKMISTKDSTGKKTFGYSLVCMVLLVITTLILPKYQASLGWAYSVSSVGLGLYLLRAIIQAYMNPTNRYAQRIVISSVVYLLLWIVVVLVEETLI